MFVFPSARGAAININNFLFRVLKKEAGKEAGVAGVTRQMLRRTFVIKSVPESVQ